MTWAATQFTVHFFGGVHNYYTLLKIKFWLENVKYSFLLFFFWIIIIICRCQSNMDQNTSRQVYLLFFLSMGIIFLIWIPAGCLQKSKLNTFNAESNFKMGKEYWCWSNFFCQKWIHKIPQYQKYMSSLRSNSLPNRNAF